MTIQDSLSDALYGIPGAVFVGCMELESKTFLGERYDESAAEFDKSFLASIHREMFDGQDALRFESALKNYLQQYSPVRPYEDVLVFFEGLIYIFMRSKHFPTYVVVFVCEDGSNIGVVLAKCRTELTQIESFL